MKILFHDNSLCLYGTTIALFDYAHFCRQKYGIDVSIIYNSTHIANHQLAINRFESEFDFVKSYSNFDQMQNLIDVVRPDAFFMIKQGPYDGVFSRNTKNWILAISPKQNGLYGDKFAVSSNWLSNQTGVPNIVPHMINLPDIDLDLRDELGIPKNAIVFGRNGGLDTFNIEFAKKAVIKVLQERPNVFFLFQGTNSFYEHERIIHLPSSSDLVTKVKFINTTNALLHARHTGESFGLTCGEFSSRNKPVITWYGSVERNHIDILGDKGIYYSNYDDLVEILRNFEPNDSIDWNCYREYLPDPVMEKFKNYYLT